LRNRTQMTVQSGTTPVIPTCMRIRFRCPQGESKYKYFIVTAIPILNI
jgi:hypothetical protein